MGCIFSYSFCPSCFLTHSSIHWVPPTGGLAFPLGSRGRRSGVFFMEFIYHFASQQPACLLHISCSLFCRWSDKTDVDFQNWAKVSGRTRKNGLCVTMSSSTGEDLQRHSCLCVASLRLCRCWLLNACVLQGSGQPVSAVSLMATFARERQCLWWRLLGSHTSSDSVQRSGSTLATRCRHTFLYVCGHKICANLSGILFTYPFNVH